MWEMEGYTGRFSCPSDLDGGGVLRNEEGVGGAPKLTAFGGSILEVLGHFECACGEAVFLLVFEESIGPAI
jgi:hypothetical protein